MDERIHFLAACSASPDATDLDVAEAVLDEDALQDSLDAKFDGALSEAEHQQALAAFAANGIAREDVEFRGRVAFLEGDMMVEVDDVLADNGAVHKGYTSATTNSLISGFSGCAPYQCGAINPTLYSRNNGGQYQFLRPDTEHVYYLVVNFRDVPTERQAKVIAWVSAAASRIMNASSGDCLATGRFLTFTKADYDALANPLGTQHHATTIEVYTDASTFVYKCSGGIACANLPGDRGIRNDSKVLSPGKHRFGDRIHINLDTVEIIEANHVAANRPAAGGAVATILHEMMHTLGYTHTGGGSGEIRIPGTSSESIPNVNNTSVPANRKGSVMRGATSDMDGWTCLPGETGLQCLPQEDELILTKLYNGSCAFSTSFRDVN